MGGLLPNRTIATAGRRPGADRLSRPDLGRARRGGVRPVAGDLLLSLLGAVRGDVAWPNPPAGARREASVSRPTRAGGCGAKWAQGSGMVAGAGQSGSRPIQP